MRILSLLVVAACVHDPDPRAPTVDRMQQGGLGAWIVIEGNYHIEGELISVEPALIRVLTADHHLLAITRGEIVSAKLFEYASEGGIGVWGALGSFSTISHGLFAGLSLPVWLITTGVTAWSESHSVLLEFPEHAWSELDAWARFPQGFPVGVDEAALVGKPEPAPRVEPPSPYPADPTDHPGPPQP